MIKIERGNVLEARAEALVNSLNCVGFMGKGLALQFKKAYPENFKAYQKACRAKEMQPGRTLGFSRGAAPGARHIINFQTKRHWKDKSLYEDIEAGLAARELDHANP